MDPNLPIPSYPTLEPTSALTFGDLITEVAYKIGCAYYGSNGEGAPQVPVDAHDLAICQNIVNKAIRKFINDGPKPNGWRWLNPIAQVDLWPQISYDPSGVTYVSMVYNNSGPLSGTTTLTLQTPSLAPQTGDIDTSYVPSFYQSMEYRQIWLNGNPPTNTPGWWAPVDEDYTGTAIGAPFTILQYLGPTQLVVDGNATAPQISINQGPNPLYSYTDDIVTTPPPPYPSQGLISFVGVVTGGSYTLTVSVNGQAVMTSGSIAWNASAGSLQTTLNAVSGISALGGVTVTGSHTAGYTVTFNGYAGYLGLGTNSLTGVQYTAPFAFAATGDYTLPATFGGQYTGDISYVANTNRGMILRWTSEFSIRSRRQNYNIESGTPYEAAVRLMPTPSYAPLTNNSGLMLPRRRWELMTWRISSEFLSVIFPYTLAFNSLTNLTDVPPSPFGHDEALKACCLAVAEKEVEDSMQGPDWAYYHDIALPQSWQVDSRSVAKALGYFSNPTNEGPANPIQAFRDVWYQRPQVPVFGPNS